jgi:hypothetical protein
VEEFGLTKESFQALSPEVVRSEQSKYKSVNVAGIELKVIEAAALASS